MLTLWLIKHQTILSKDSFSRRQITAQKDMPVPQQSPHYLEAELNHLMKEDESIFQFIQNSCLDGLWYWDLEKPDNEWMNNRFWEVLGYNPDDKPHSSREWKELIYPEDLPLIENNVKAHNLDPTKQLDQIVRYWHKNGSTVWVRCKGIIIRKNGKPIRMIGAHIDYTKVKEYEEKYKRNLREMDRVYADVKLAYEESEQLFTYAPEAIIKVQTDGSIIKANEQMAKLFGYSVEELENMNVSNLIPDNVKRSHPTDMKNYFEHGETRKMGEERGKLQAIRKNGEPLTIEITLSLIQTRYGKNALAIIRDVSEKQELIESLQNQLKEIEELEALTIIDSLTKVNNKRYFEDQIQQEFENFKRHHYAYSLLVIDIDHFKQVNDTFGHAKGDEIIRAIANTLNELKRFGDTLARIGGDEFAILLPHTNIDSALAISDRIVYAIENEKIIYDKDNKHSVTLSIGAAMVSTEDTSCHMAFERADKALYISKQQGRNRASIIER